MSCFNCFWPIRFNRIFHFKNSTLVKIILIALITLSALLLSGCEQYAMRTSSPIQIYKRQFKSALNSSQPSLETMQTLRLEFLDEQYKCDPISAVKTLYQRIRESEDRNLMVAAAELSLLEGRKHYKKDKGVSMAMYLKSAEIAYDYLFPPGQFDQAQTLQPSYAFIQLIYNRAVSRFAAIHQLCREQWPDMMNFSCIGNNYKISIKQNCDENWDINHFDKLLAANQIEVKGLKNKYYTRGLGAAMIGLIDNFPDHPVFDEFSPDNLVAQPVTVVIEFEDSNDADQESTRCGTISFINPLLTDTIKINSINVPLEADFSTPFGVLLANIDARESNVWELFTAKERIDEAGIYMLEPYRDDQIPVVMVHGIMSYPATWVQMFNDLRGDPEIRKKYQFWFFLYPTGMPLLYSASILRNNLLEIQQKYDPDGTNPNFNKMVLVGHSMGGLLSKLMTQDSGTVFWDDVFVNSPEMVCMNDQNREFIKNVLIFDKLDFIEKVIFLATPHQGSEQADSIIARVGELFITYTDDIENLRKDLNKEDLTIEAMEFMDSVPNGIRQLSPASPDIRLISSMELNPDIEYYSIIATGKSCQGPGSNDGLVAYESSHLEGVKSEILIQSRHYVHKHPMAIAEVKKILNGSNHEDKKAAASKITFAPKQQTLKNTMQLQQLYILDFLKYRTNLSKSSKK